VNVTSHGNRTATALGKTYSSVAMNNVWAYFELKAKRLITLFLWGKAASRSNG